MAQRFAQLASNAADPDRAVAATPGWSILDTFGHVAMEPSRYHALALGGGTWPACSSELPAYNAEQVRTLPTRDAQQLAVRLTTDTRQFVELIDSFDGEPRLMNFDGNQRIRADRSLGTLLGEFVVHGYDIADTVGEDWPIDPAHVPLILQGTHQVMPGWVNPVAAAGLSAVYRLQLRGLGISHIYQFHDGTLTVDPDSPGPVDVQFDADPVTWLLLSYGRLSADTRVLADGVAAWPSSVAGRPVLATLLFRLNRRSGNHRYRESGHTAGTDRDRGDRTYRRRTLRTHP
nr:maleylpyruvate isomerase family mycothiol-dependent enzyme [Nocardioides kongjuensis]